MKKRATTMNLISDFNKQVLQCENVFIERTAQLNFGERSFLEKNNE